MGDAMRRWKHEDRQSDYDYDHPNNTPRTWADACRETSNYIECVILLYSAWCWYIGGAFKFCILFFLKWLLFTKLLFGVLGKGILHRLPRPFGPLAPGNWWAFSHGSYFDVPWTEPNY